MDEENENEKWRTHPVPVSAAGSGRSKVDPPFLHADSINDDNQRIFKGTATIALQPYGKVGAKYFGRILVCSTNSE